MSPHWEKITSHSKKRTAFSYGRSSNDLYGIRKMFLSKSPQSFTKLRLRSIFDHTGFIVSSPAWRAHSVNTLGDGPAVVIGIEAKMTSDAGRSRDKIPFILYPKKRKQNEIRQKKKTKYRQHGCEALRAKNIESLKKLGFSEISIKSNHVETLRTIKRAVNFAFNGILLNNFCRLE